MECLLLLFEGKIKTELEKGTQLNDLLQQRLEVLNAKIAAQTVALGVTCTKIGSILEVGAHHHHLHLHRHHHCRHYQQGQAHCRAASRGGEVVCVSGFLNFVFRSIRSADWEAWRALR